MPHADPGKTAAVTPSADLALLVVTEQALEQQLAEAHDQARAMIESAYTAAGARSAEQKRELADRRQHSEAEVAAQRDRQAAEVLEQGRQRAAEFDAVAEGRVSELAGLVLARLLSGVGG